ncbi:MAG: division/cell wall cluster transcriptional repressor MraZ [Coxiellaceae bacterium]|nr:division/cell wall cluster transcriptional repressor MraZ [Coxiellaceae bacterium]
MFRGLTANALDAKGRMAIPSRYRALLQIDGSSSLVITIDTEEPCLLMYPYCEWELIEQKLEALPSFNSATRRIQRLLIGHATEVEMDKQGRVLIPPLLREYADLEKNIMLVGQGNKFEVWGEKQWHSGRDTWLQQKHDGDGGLPAELHDLSL